MINTFILSGTVKRIDINTKQAKKGPAAIVTLQYGPARERTEQAVQFINLAVIRIPPYVLKKCEHTLKVGAVIDVVGHTQGVLKHHPGADSFIANEYVVDRLEVAVESEDASPSPVAEAFSKMGLAGAAAVPADATDE